MLTQTLEAPQSEKPLSERRRSPRHDYAVAAWLSSEAGIIKSNQKQVQVFNLSLHGVGLKSPDAISEGAIHWIVIGNGPLHLSARLRVVSCRAEADGQYRIGGEFF